MKMGSGRGRREGAAGNGKAVSDLLAKGRRGGVDLSISKARRPAKAGSIALSSDSDSSCAGWSRVSALNSSQTALQDVRCCSICSEGGTDAALRCSTSLAAKPGEAGSSSSADGRSWSEGSVGLAGHSNDSRSWLEGALGSGGARKRGIEQRGETKKGERRGGGEAGRRRRRTRPAVPRRAL